MKMMRQRHGFIPAKGRTPGDGGYPMAVDYGLPDLPPLRDEVRVGVIDIGLAVDGEGKAHPWFADHVRFQPDQAYMLATEPGELCRFDGHADFVTGLILREAPMALVVLDGALGRDNVNDRRPASDEEDGRVADAISKLAGEQVQVINLSFSGEMFTEDSDATKIQEAITAHPHIAFVAAAGNDGGNDKVWPAAFDGVYAVGAVDEYQTDGFPPLIASFSNYGAWVDVFAGGVLELSSFPTFDETHKDGSGVPTRQHFAGWARWSGTSFAAARVSGRIASIVAERGCTGSEAVEALLKDSSPTKQGVRWVPGAQVR